jgi:hypothetical protein
MAEQPPTEKHEPFYTEAVPEETTEVPVKSELAADKLPYLFFDRAKHESETASKLAFSFAYILAGAIFLHYLALFTFSTVALFAKNSAQVDRCIKSIQDTYSIWLPALVGIVSSVTTYYFIRERK